MDYFTIDKLSEGKRNDKEETVSRLMRSLPLTYAVCYYSRIYL